MKNESNIVITDELIVQYLVGESNPEEAIALHEWLTEPDNKLHFEKLLSAWQSAYPSKKPKTPNPQMAWKTLQSKMHNISSDNVDEKIISIKSSGKFYLKFAAAILLICIAGLFAYQVYNKPVPVVQTRIATKDNLKQTILPDNSKAVISRYSNITYNKNFEGSTREVYLSGEAFFEVTHDTNKPFIVHTGVADIRVVGTAFNVAVKNNRLEVTVAKGKVLIYTAHDSVYLTQKQGLTIGSSAQFIKSDTLLDINKWGYATRKFEFANTPLREVFDCIEKSYPCLVKVKNENIKNCKLTARFEDVSVDYIVSLIAETLDLTLIKKGNVFILEGQGCP